jgi:hypothetical protein
MILTNHANLPQQLLDAVRNDPYNPAKTGHISVTRLIDSPRAVALRKRHANEITEDAADRVWALLGQVAHGILERSNTVFSRDMAEQRLFADVGGWRVSGQFDRLSLDDGGTLSDWKLTSTWSVIGPEPKLEWTAQLNTLAFLARHNGIRVSKLEIIALLRDWSRGRARAGGDYPPHQVARIPIPLWPQSVAADYVAARVGLHQAAEGLPDDELPPCTDAEVWRAASVFAVRKPGRKTAVRLHATEIEATTHARELGGAHYVEHRPGRATRCQNYCPVSALCNQWRAEQAAGGDDNIEGES